MVQKVLKLAVSAVCCSNECCWTDIQKNRGSWSVYTLHHIRHRRRHFGLGVSEFPHKRCAKLRFCYIAFIVRFDKFEERQEVRGQPSCKQARHRESGCCQSAVLGVVPHVTQHCTKSLPFQTSFFVF